ncbi:MAG: InlB B-repeat-containing protein, partial [Kiritimatiellae bacterium]|nr:InlB B-repeat-containing protein [Kiritimatiellia bacterium]
LPKPTGDGHVFLGWFDAAKGGNQVTAETIVPTMANRTLHAQWTTTQTVTFDANGGTCNTTTKKATIGAKYGTLPKATREGYMFLGWFTSPEGGKQVTTNHTVTATAARTFYAHWIDHQTVTFDAQGGTCDTVTMDFDIGGKYAGLPDAEWEGHVFAGWFTAAEGGKRVTTNHTVTTALSRIFWAQWNVSASSLAISGFAMKPAGTANARGGRGPVPGVLSFEAEAGRVYELQWTPVLGGEWTTLRRWTADADGEADVEVPSHSGESSGFYRLAAPAVDAE